MPGSENAMSGLATGVVIDGLGAPAPPDEAFGGSPGFFTAQIDGESGELRVVDPDLSTPPEGLDEWFTVFGAPIPGAPFPSGYHVCDYAFFWANIRVNVVQRVAAFVAA